MVRVLSAARQPGPCSRPLRAAHAVGATNRTVQVECGNGRTLTYSRTFASGSLQAAGSGEDRPCPGTPAARPSRALFSSRGGTAPTEVRNPDPGADHAGDTAAADPRTHLQATYSISIKTGACRETAGSRRAAYTSHDDIVTKRSDDTFTAVD